LKRILSVFVCLILCVSLCGCKFYSVDTDNLLSPPKLTGDMYPISKAIEKTAPAGYKLKYPTTGTNKSAVMLEDVDGDESNEAIAFYQTTDDDQITMNINIIRYDKENAKSIDIKSVTASGVDKVEFCDLDGDGVKEILVGFEIYANSEKQLMVYSLTSNTLISRFEQKYTNFACPDFDGDGKNELLIQLLDTKEGLNKASLFTLSNEGVEQTTGCIMDGTVKTAGEFKLSSLSTGQTAIYVDEIKGIGAITEVLFVVKGELENTLLDLESEAENNKTLRAANIFSADINGDGIIEIPIASELPRVDDNSTENLYYTNWCSFNGETLTVKQVSLMNSADGYKIDIQRNWLGSIAAAKDTEKRTRTIYRYDSDTKTVGEKIVTFRAMKKSKWEKLKDSKQFKIAINGDTVYTATLNENGSDDLPTETQIKTMFSLYNY